MLDEKAVSEMTNEQIIAEIEKIRERRSQARERRVQERNEKSAPKEKRGPAELSGELGSLLDNLLTEETET